MIMLPASALLVSLTLGSLSRILGVIGSALVISAALGAWAKRKVAAGAWAHIDASNPDERHQWNRVVLICFLLVAAVFAYLDRMIAAGAAALAFIMVCAIALEPLLKLSQHTAFTVMSAFVAGSVEPFVGAVFAGLALGVAWSRLALKRHTVPEVIVGAICGSLAGGGLWWLVKDAFGL